MTCLLVSYSPARGSQDGHSPLGTWGVAQAAPATPTAYWDVEAVQPGTVQPGARAPPEGPPCNGGVQPQATAVRGSPDLTTILQG